MNALVSHPVQACNPGKASEACPEKKSVDMGTDRLGMRIAVDWDIKPQTMQKNNYRILACMHDHTHARTQFLR